VDRSFFYRHADLLAQIHAAQAQPAKITGGSSVTMTSLQADLVNAQDRESGLGTPNDIDQMKRRITELEQQVVDLKETWPSASKNSTPREEQTVTSSASSTAHRRARTGLPLSTKGGTAMRPPPHTSND
jgi:hypothetical protein